MKTYRLVNTAQGELPVVGDEAMHIIVEPGDWFLLEDDIDVSMVKRVPEHYIIRRELHPQEMAKEIAKMIYRDFNVMEYELPPYGDGAQHASLDTIVKCLLPHIQAALEGKA